MRKLLAAACATLLSGCATLRANPTVEAFQPPELPIACAEALDARQSYGLAVERSRRTRAELHTAQERLEDASNRSSALRRSATRTPESQALQQQADAAVGEAQRSVSHWSEQQTDAERRIVRSAEAADKAGICRAMKNAQQRAVAFHDLAMETSDSEVGASSLRLFSAIAGATFLALNPRNTDNIAGAALIGGSAEAWRSGLKPGERSIVLERAADALVCVVETSSVLVSFTPSEAEMALTLENARRGARVAAVYIDGVKATSPESESSERTASIRRFETALIEVNNAANELSSALLARERAAQQISDATRLIINNTQAQLKGLAPNVGAVVDLVTKLPESLATKTPAAADSPAAPADSNAGRGPRARIDDTFEIRRNAVELENLAAEIRALLRNNDQEAFRAIAECAAT